MFHPNNFALRTLAFLLLIAVAPAHVAAQECSTESVIVYSNGVGNTVFDAFSSLDRINEEIYTAFPDERRNLIEFDLAINRTDGGFVDVIEAIVQAYAVSFTQAIRWFVGLDAMPEGLQHVIAPILARLSSNISLNGDLANHVTYYKSKIAEGRKVVVVAHSQGNYFANLARNGLSGPEQASFGIVAIANPASFVGGGGPHVTSFVDVPIALIPGSMAPNALNGVILNDLTGHGLTESYMRGGAASRPMITSNITSVEAGLQTPTSTTGAGIITVTLTWGSQPDVDLHAFEPNGAHVYYANRTGPSGHLDVDDVSGFGPEHYFVSCETLEAGNYRVGVNYYEGLAPETANVQIQAGFELRNFSVPLGVAQGDAGDNSPVGVANIVVTGTAQTGYTFSIE